MTTKTYLIRSLLLGLALASSTFAQQPEATEKPDPEFAIIQDKYAAEYKKLEEQGNNISKDAPKGAENAVGIDIDLSKWHDISFDIPEFRMKRQHVAFDLP